MKVEPAALGVVCGYELAALLTHSDRVPTITALVSRLPKFARRAISCAAGVWLIRHFD